MIDAKETYIHYRKEIKEIILLFLQKNPAMANYYLNGSMYIDVLKEAYGITKQDFMDLASERRKHAMVSWLRLRRSRAGK